MRNDPKNFEPLTPIWGPLFSEVVTPITGTLADELVAFYDSTLVPELVCGGNGPDRPPASWMVAEGRKVVLCRDKRDKLLGCWIIKEHGIYYPCVDVTEGVSGVVAILRSLAYRSFREEGTALWASTNNAMIHQWAKSGRDTPQPDRPQGMPIPTFATDRIEWK